MTSDPDFQPIFGPNGAVLNAPSMTPEMRAKFDEVGKIPARPVIVRYAGVVVVFALAMVLASNFGQPLHELMTRSPWWNGAAMGAASAIAAVVVGSQARTIVRRHGLTGTTHALTAPLWARLLLAVLTIAVSAGHAVFLVVLTAKMLTDELPSGFAELGFASFGVAVACLLLSLLLSWAGRRRGWIMADAARPPA